MDQLRGRPGGGHPFGRGGAAVRGSVVHDPEHPVRAGVRLGGHHLLGQPGERRDPGGVLAPAGDLSAVDVPGGQVGQRAAAVIVVLDRIAWLCPGGRVGWQRHRAWIEVFSSAQIT